MMSNVEHLMSYGRKFSLLGALLSLSWITVASAVGEESEIRFGTACGPCSVYTALRCMGVNLGFDDVATRCGWHQEGRVSVANISEALQQFPQINVKYATLSAAEVETHIDAGGVVIVLVAKDAPQLNHAFCIVDRRDRQFQVVDFPKVNQLMSYDELRGIWKGEAILVSRSNSARFAREWPFYLLPACVVFFGAFRACGCSRKVRMQCDSPG